MMYQLSSQQSAQWIEGNWLAYEIEETVLEDLDRAGISEPVVVTLDTGVVAFAVTAKGVDHV
jgi:hypothetical protein